MPQSGWLARTHRPAPGDEACRRDARRPAHHVAAASTSAQAASAASLGTGSGGSSASACARDETGIDLTRRERRVRATRCRNSTLF